MPVTILIFLAGLVFLILGAEVLVRGSSRLAAALGISPLIIGLTVVAFGTSSPEFAVSFQSALDGQAGLVVGNVVGSNIFNVLFILGLAALITPLMVSQQLVRFDVPLLVAVSLLVPLLALDGLFSRLEGLLLFAGLVAYLVFLAYLGRKGNQREEAPPIAGINAGPGSGWRSMLRNIGLAVVGLGMLALGSRWLVRGAVEIAQALGLSELIIGLTIIAAGTSLPEVVTSVIASLRGERDIAVGNAVGSNLFNLLGVLGLASLLAPGGIQVSPAAVRFDIPVMAAVAVACLPIFFTGCKISRWEGGLFLGYYLAYTLYLILGATQHDALPVFNAAMLYFVLPLTVITLLLVVSRTIQRRRRGLPDCGPSEVG